ncbi:hypothetical protein ACFT9I_07960 [Streptomyces sp. NPDC057137]|uniref:hypothetical protein n=1 Tax=Streptomyces sp. NPDC057137 TaxID=3346030 RepID=UPI00364149AD
MPWGEWDQLKAEAAEKQGMQLNQLPADPGGGGGNPSGVQGDLVVNQDDLGAVGNEAFKLHDHLGKQADIAGAGMNKDGAGTTMQAAASLKSHNFALGPALETTVETWSAQLKTLLQACAHISNHLDYTKASHARDEEQIRASLRTDDGSAVPVSRINEYFK